MHAISHLRLTKARNFGKLWIAQSLEYWLSGATYTDLRGSFLLAHFMPSKKSFGAQLLYDIPLRSVWPPPIGHLQRKVCIRHESEKISELDRLKMQLVLSSEIIITLFVSLPPRVWVLIILYLHLSYISHCGSFFISLIIDCLFC